MGGRPAPADGRTVRTTRPPDVPALSDDVAGSWESRRLAPTRSGALRPRTAQVVSINLGLRRARRSPSSHRNPTFTRGA